MNIAYSQLDDNVRAAFDAASPGPIQHAERDAYTETALACGCVLTSRYAHLNQEASNRCYNGCECGGSIGVAPGHIVATLCEKHAESAQ